MGSGETQIRDTLAGICGRFQVPGELVGFRPIPQGHINTAYEVLLREGSEVRRYLVQRITRSVFPDPAGLMGNIDRITAHLTACGERTLHFYRATDGAGYVTIGEGEQAGAWRLCDYIGNSVTFEAGEGSLRVLTAAGKAFGRFARRLLDLDASELTETIPRFHDTAFRLRAFSDAAAADPHGRGKEAAREIAVIRENRSFAETLSRQLEGGELPLRVTHNDTKLNNVLFDRDTLEPLAVIDLDTCMPGLVCHDFGDAVRFAAWVPDGSGSSGRRLDPARFRALTEGYLSETKGFLTPAELDSLATGAAVITLELASRFLGDYILGDPYFRIERPDHNLIRARSQLSLFQDMMAHMEDMREIIRDCAGRL